MKTICIYYSYTGNTKLIANMLQSKLHCDLLELEPATPYSTNYNEVVDEFQNNEQSGATTKLKDFNLDLSLYDRIIIGTPVWWYATTPVIRTFLKETDLSDKTIIPFATNAGWLGQTLEEIKKLCPSSLIKEPMNIIFDDYKTPQIKNKSAVEDWIERISE